MRAYGVVIPWMESKVSYEGEECLIFPFGRMKNGYGKLGVGKRTVSAHRHMCGLAHGEPPSPIHQAAHSCGNGHLGCVNPKHLRWATPKENCADTQATQNHDRGENNPAAILTEDDVVSIRYLCAHGVKQNAVARMFGIAKETVFGIYRKNRWPHVTRSHSIIEATNAL